MRQGEGIRVTCGAAMIFWLAARPSSEFISCCISACEVQRSRCGGAAASCAGAQPGGRQVVHHVRAHEAARLLGPDVPRAQQSSL